MARRNAEETTTEGTKARKRKTPTQLVNVCVNRDLKNLQVLKKHLLRLTPEAHEKVVKEYRLAVERLAERSDDAPKFALDEE